MICPTPTIFTNPYITRSAHCRCPPRTYRYANLHGMVGMPSPRCSQLSPDATICLPWSTHSWSVNTIITISHEETVFLWITTSSLIPVLLQRITSLIHWPIADTMWLIEPHKTLNSISLHLGRNIFGQYLKYYHTDCFRTLALNWAFEASSGHGTMVLTPQCSAWSPHSSAHETCCLYCQMPLLLDHYPQSDVCPVHRLVRLLGEHPEN